jgi:phosphopantothenoylcysteine decarboxylase / phosphopantothenate---cysteine ligase
VGFAAESEKLIEHAREKLARKKLPVIVGNLGPATFGRDDNALVIIDAATQRELPGGGVRADKLTLARELVREIARRLAAKT